MAKTKALAIKAEVVDAQPDKDQWAVEDAGPGIQTFLRNAGKFFAGARELEMEAVSLAKRVTALAVPTSGRQDVALQQGIKECRTIYKRVQEHWSLRKLFYGVNKLMLDAEKRGLEPLTAAAQQAQTRHNRWVSDEERRAAG